MQNELSRVPMILCDLFNIEVARDPMLPLNQDSLRGFDWITFDDDAQPGV